MISACSSMLRSDKQISCARESSLQYMMMMIKEMMIMMMMIIIIEMMMVGMKMMIAVRPIYSDLLIVE